MDYKVNQFKYDDSHGKLSNSQQSPEGIYLLVYLFIDDD